MNSPIPNSTPELKHSFAHCGRYGVYLVSGLPCPAHACCTPATLRSIAAATHGSSVRAATRTF
jgi:hypothetical protein